MHLLLLNLGRKPLRTLLTVLGIGLALLLFCFLEMVLTAFNAGAEMADALRLIVQHKESIMFELPMAYRQLISQVDGVVGVADAAWFGGLSQEPRPNGTKREEFFAQFAADLASYLPLFPEVQVPREQLTALMEDQMGCLLGHKIAERLNKKVGDRLVLRSTIWTQKNGSSIWEFNVRAIYTTDSPTFDPTMMLFPYRRFDEAREFGQGLAGFYYLAIDDATRSAEVSQAIDSRFANSPYETRTMTEKAFNLQFIGMMGNFQLLLRSIGSAVVLTMLLVSANTMMMSARERTREMGILKAIGCTVSLAFHGLKTGMANWATFSETAFEFLVTPRILAAAAGISLLMGFLGGVIPAVHAARMKVVDALRRV